MIPTFLRFPDLKAKGIVTNWTTLLRWIERGEFPAGVLLGPNTRAWSEQVIAEWLERRGRESGL
jgi:predicted DNA-binding transcriptional regulator AlpA